MTARASAVLAKAQALSSTAWLRRGKKGRQDGNCSLQIQQNVTTKLSIHFIRKEGFIFTLTFGWGLKGCRMPKYKRAKETVVWTEQCTWRKKIFKLELEYFCIIKLECLVINAKRPSWAIYIFFKLMSLCCIFTFLSMTNFSLKKGSWD